jgi:hypothetical protein
MYVIKKIHQRSQKVLKQIILLHWFFDTVFRQTGKLPSNLEPHGVTSQKTDLHSHRRENLKQILQINTR